MSVTYLQFQTEVCFWCWKSAADPCQLFSRSLCFLAKRYSIQQKCLKRGIGSLFLGTRQCNFSNFSATPHNVTERHTDEWRQYVYDAPVAVWR